MPKINAKNRGDRLNTVHFDPPKSPLKRGTFKEIDDVPTQFPLKSEE